MKKTIIATATLIALFSASVAFAQFSSSAPQGADTGANGDGASGSGSMGATDGGR